VPPNKILITESRKIVEGIGEETIAVRSYVITITC
jgi:hypothetical protein